MMLFQTPWFLIYFSTVRSIPVSLRQRMAQNSSLVLFMLPGFACASQRFAGRITRISWRERSSKPNWRSWNAWHPVCLEKQCSHRCHSWERWTWWWKDGEGTGRNKMSSRNPDRLMLDFDHWCSDPWVKDRLGLGKPVSSWIVSQSECLSVSQWVTVSPSHRVTESANQWFSESGSQRVSEWAT